MFGPPAPKVPPVNTVVAPYAADASQLKLWELKQQRHRIALAAIPKAGSLTDQREPLSTGPLSLQKAREKARLFAVEEARRHIGEGNKVLMGHLAEIVQKPSMVCQMIENAPPRLPPIVTRHEQLRRRQQKALDEENEALTRRLQRVRGTINRSSNEKEYQRHLRDVERMKKVNSPNPRRQKSMPLLPKLLRPSESPGADGARTLQSSGSQSCGSLELERKHGRRTAATVTFADELASEEAHGAAPPSRGSEETPKMQPKAEAAEASGTDAAYSCGAEMGGCQALAPDLEATGQEEQAESVASAVDAESADPESSERGSLDETTEPTEARRILLSVALKVIARLCATGTREGPSAVLHQGEKMLSSQT